MDVVQRLVQHFGHGPRPYPKELVNSQEGRRCVVVATAACVWDDLKYTGCTGDFNNDWHVMCVNDIAMHYPGVVNHLYSNQHRWIPHWCAARRETIGGRRVRDHWGDIGATHSCRVGGQYQWPWPGHGTSTLNAVYTAFALGYNPIVICGAPLDNSNHYFEPEWVTNNFEREVATRKGTDILMYWGQAYDKFFKGRVFSQSGRTMELLGAYRP